MNTNPVIPSSTVFSAEASSLSHQVLMTMATLSSAVDVSMATASSAVDAS